jgi:hypothetical protein
VRKRAQRFACAEKAWMRGSYAETWCGRRRRLDRVAPEGVDPDCLGCLAALAADAALRLEDVDRCDHGGGEGVCPFCGDDVPIDTRPARDAGTAVLLRPK